MKHLIIFSHFNNNSFAEAIKNTIVSSLTSRGEEVELRDLYKIGFDPILKLSDKESMSKGIIPQDIAIEQKYISEADYIHFVYPIWWTGLPAMIKGYIDRVLSYGFAYSAGESGIVGLLKKKVTAVNTHGFPKDYYQQIGMYNAFNLTMDKGIFEFCGMEVVKHHFFGSVPYISDEERKVILNEIGKYYSSELVIE